MNKRLSVSWIFALVCLVLLTAGLATAAAQAGEDTQELKALYEEGKNLWFGINGKDYDREAAIDCFRRAAEAGYADAWYYLGNTTLTGTDPGRYTAAMEQYRKAEELGSLLALYGEARLYHYGRGTELNREKAKELYEKAIAGGCVEAYEGLSALMLDDVDGQDVDKAIQYGEKALEGEDFQIVCRAMISISEFCQAMDLPVVPEKDFFLMGAFTTVAYENGRLQSLKIAGKDCTDNVLYWKQNLYIGEQVFSVLGCTFTVDGDTLAIRYK